MPAVPFLIMGGAQLAGGLIQSHQAGKAADAQKAAAQQALSLQTQAYQQGQAGLAPFTQLGQGTLGNLYRMTGQTPPTAPTGPSGPTGPWTQGNSGPVQMRGPNGQMISVPNGPGIQTALRSGARVQQMVNMRAPDGSTQQVPQEQVAHFQQLGATVVG